MSGGKVALILTGTLLGIVALLVTVMFVVREQVAGTGHELAWQVESEPDDRDEDFAGYLVGDEFVRVSTLGIVGYDIGDGEQKSKKRFAADELCHAADQNVQTTALLVVSQAKPCDTLLSVDLGSGDTNWRVPLERAAAADEVRSPGFVGVAATDRTNTYAFVSTGHRLQAVDLRSGTSAWTLPLKSRCRVEDVAADRQRVVVAAYCGDDPRDHMLTALDPRTGKEQWSVTYAKQTTDEYEASLVSTNPLAVLTVDDDKTKGKSELRLFGTDGRSKRTVGARADDSAEELEDGTVSTFEVVGRRLVCATRSDKLVGFDLASGDREWSTDVSGLSGTFVEGVADGELAFIHGYRHVRYSTVDPETGDVDRGKRLPEGATDHETRYWQSADHLIAINHYPTGDEPWLAAYREK